MSTIYIPRVIESEAEADALPVGTIAYQDRRKGGRSTASKALDPRHGEHALWAVEGVYGRSPEVVGWAALVSVKVDAVDSQPLGLSRRGAEFIERASFTCYIDYKETP